LIVNVLFAAARSGIGSEALALGTTVNANQTMATKTDRSKLMLVICESSFVDGLAMRRCGAHGHRQRSWS
jgi:hypothetical protein